MDGPSGLDCGIALALQSLPVDVPIEHDIRLFGSIDRHAIVCVTFTESAVQFHVGDLIVISNIISTAETTSNYIRDRFRTFSDDHSNENREDAQSTITIKASVQSGHLRSRSSAWLPAHHDIPTWPPSPLVFSTCGSLYSNDSPIVPCVMCSTSACYQIFLLVSLSFNRIINVLLCSRVYCIIKFNLHTVIYDSFRRCCCCYIVFLFCSTCC